MKLKLSYLMSLIIVVFVVFAPLIGTVRAGPYDDWPYYIRVFVTENSGQDLVNYPFKIRIEWKPGMKPDFSDIRVSYINSTTLEETPTCYWIESYNEYDYADIWVLIPYLPANETVELKIYYGNELAKSQSNKECVFQGITILEDDFTSDKGWVFESDVEAAPDYSVSTSGQVITEDGVYNLHLEGVVNRYEEYYVRAYNTLDIPCNGRLNITVYYLHNSVGSYDIYSKIWFDSDVVYKSPKWYDEGTDLKKRTVEFDVSSGTHYVRVGFTIYMTSLVDLTLDMNITYVKVKLIPYANPAPSYGITYPQTTTYTPRPFTRTVSVVYPTHSITPYYFPAPPNVNLEEVRDVTVGGIISLGMLLAIAIALIRAGAGVLSIASAAGLVTIIGLLINNTGIVSAGTTVFLVTIAYYLARKKIR